MRKKFLPLILLIVFTQVFIILPVESNPDQPPQGATAGSYVIWESKFWVIYNKTVEELGTEGFLDLTDEYPNDWLLQVNYSRNNYSFISKIFKVDYPSVTIEIVENWYDLNVTVRRILR